VADGDDTSRPPAPGDPHDLRHARDPRALAADALATALATAGGQRLLRDLQRLGLTEPPGAPAAETPAAVAPPGPRPISIWSPREEAGEIVWVRPPRLPLGDHYAAVSAIRPKRGALPRRICFFGESAAAGYLYAPHLTPAGVLAAQLREAAGDGETEVIDLARTNETLASLVETARASLQLSPDLLVIYAGNNWSLLETPEISPYPPSVRGRQRYAEAVRGGGILGPARMARERLAGIAQAAMAEIAQIARAAGAPVVLVVPEVNLADWETRQPTVWLAGDATARWHEAYGRAGAALAAGDFGAAEARAWEMAELDGGSGPAPFRFLAAALRGQGREAAARDAAISEVDSVHYPLLAFLAAPQATTLARELLLGFARGQPRETFAAVDLRRVFAAWTGSALPGRRLFLDYCHLTAEGIKVAMSAVAAQAIRLLRLGEPSWEDLARGSPDPRLPPGAEAAALLGAAIHTAHRMLPVTLPPPDGVSLPEDVRLAAAGAARRSSPARQADPVLPDGFGGRVAHWIDRALDASPAAADALLDLADARTAPCPTVLTGAQQRNLGSPCRLELQHGWVYDFLDAGVLEAATAALARRGEARSTEIQGEIERLLVGRLGLSEAGADLARPYFHAEPLARFYPELIGDRDAVLRAHQRSPWPESGFVLVTDAARRVALELTARLPGRESAGQRGGRVTVAVNGRAAGELELASRWTTGRLTVPRRLLRRGLNRVVLRWPPPSADGERALEAALCRLEEGLEADLHPVFGEIWSLVARPAG
jgi:hypothetical protein